MVEVAVTEHLPAELRVNPNLATTFRAFWREGYTALKVVPGLHPVTEEEVVLSQAGKGETLGCNNFLFVEGCRADEIRGLCLEAITAAGGGASGREQMSRSA